MPISSALDYRLRQALDAEVEVLSVDDGLDPEQSRLAAGVGIRSAGLRSGVEASKLYDESGLLTPALSATASIETASIISG
ncbi:MAG: hypothetical protein JO265_15370 [Acidimicrobiia bacterium]|nr:hypothetical protein [Acidimicrobiia bacterium]